MHGYERSTHDLGYIWRSTMACGTLVPFMSLVGLPGDTFDIELNADVKTHPALGPLFGSFKLQLDLFSVPIRLYNATLHNNPLEVGMTMNSIKFPLLEVECNQLQAGSEVPIEMQQVNPSSLMAYLGVRGFGNSIRPNFKRYFNAIPTIAYWDIYKNYYINKQEEAGYCLHNEELPVVPLMSKLVITQVGETIVDEAFSPTDVHSIRMDAINIGGLWNDVQLSFACDIQQKNLYKIKFDYSYFNTETNLKETKTIFDYIDKFFEEWRITENGLWFSKMKIYPLPWEQNAKIDFTSIEANTYEYKPRPTVHQFPLRYLDDMRKAILQHSGSSPFVINRNGLSPYSLPLRRIDPDITEDPSPLCCSLTQEGLALKTYQSDLFNNWLRNEWVGESGSISEITRIDVSEGSFTIDTLNLAKKVYDLLNRVAVSGGTYQDWIETVYDHDSYFATEIPRYEGGLSKEIIFQEITSFYGSSEENPLGSLAGRGTLSQKHKGGKSIIRVNEPCYIMGIVSITPRIDYSQGNDWSVNLLTLDDLHKPQLDEIGFQDLLCDLMSASTTQTDVDFQPEFTAIGKVPAWINYMTNFNKVYGNFADPRSEMFMTLNRRYEHHYNEVSKRFEILDQTTYIDPEKYNYIFAQTELDAQNFWVQIAVDCTARRKMSAKQIPNL